MALFDFVRTKYYKNFMSKLYGWGASVVIIGALFKINHYTGADVMLIIGLGTESIIFFFSAFEPPHVEPDWSLVYPQLAGIYHGDEIDSSKAFTTTDTVTQELDKMLEKAKIGPELISSLGTGLKNLSETTSKLSNVADASLANDKYVSTMKVATESANLLNDSYRKTANTLEQNARASEEQLSNIKSTSKSAASLSTMFTEVSESLKEDLQANKAFTASMANVTATANNFIDKYSESANMLSKAAETLNATATGGTAYNKELQRVSNNLSALNALYELHLQSANQQMENTNKFNSVLTKFASNLNESISNSEKFKAEVENLTKNIAALNKVYGNMLSAMSVGGK
ncbi:MAG: gliding motility protein GldL [Bacteroidales bacterium]|nr:gliding motility protein GldL [Bacteroidales bacterium]NCA75721.1 gliding motility protein GldL [Alphaproteobacteria bacterium]HNW72158.1 gliding motility protein GldL [Bacteroidales bacterium]HPS49369.1 gliding motility protein GldL [Bacteroidales bacterium]